MDEKSKEKIVGVTPARGGSKRIPGKNLMLWKGEPLLKHTFDSVKESRLLTRYIVSTEDKKIIDYCNKNKVESISRPFVLANDFTPTVDVLQYILGVVDVDVFVLLQCTSPMRSDWLIDYCIKEFKRDNVNTLFTCFIRGSVYVLDGSVFVIDAETVRRGLIIGKFFKPFIVKEEDTIDI